jgi:hypothetical protein
MNSYYRSMTLALFALALAAVGATKLVNKVYAAPKYVTIMHPKIVKAVCPNPPDNNGIYYRCWVYTSSADWMKGWCSESKDITGVKPCK